MRRSGAPSARRSSMSSSPRCPPGSKRRSANVACASRAASCSGSASPARCITIPQVLVLDEATSALDTATERGVMAAVRALRGRKTLIIVAHRLSTVEQCDWLYRLKAGRIVEAGETAADAGGRGAAVKALSVRGAGHGRGRLHRLASHRGAGARRPRGARLRALQLVQLVGLARSLRRRTSRGGFEVIAGDVRDPHGVRNATARVRCSAASGGADRDSLLVPFA